MSRQVLKNWLSKIPAVVYVFAVLFIIAMLLYENFFTRTNISNILRQSSVLGMASIGMSIVIICGSIDLSVGMMLGFAGAIAIKFQNNFLMAVLITLSLCALVGLANGVIIAKLKLPPMITTISMMFLIRGLIFIINGPSAVRISSNATAFQIIGRGFIAGIPNPTIIFFIVTAVCAFVLKNTTLGRHIYAVGGNADSAAMMGIRNDRTLILAHVICSIIAGIAGMIMTSRLGAITPLQGDAYETRAITAAVLGGTLLSGGVGSVWGTFAGTLVLGIISNTFNFQGNIMAGWQYVLNGLLLIIVVILQSQELRRMIVSLIKKLRKLAS